MVLDSHWFGHHEEARNGNVSQLDDEGHIILKGRTFFSESALIEDGPSHIPASLPAISAKNLPVKVSGKAGIRRGNSVEKVSNFNITKSLNKTKLRLSLDRHGSRILPPVPLSHLQLKRKYTDSQQSHDQLYKARRLTAPSNVSHSQVSQVSPSQIASQISSIQSPPLQSTSLVPTPPLPALPLPLRPSHTPSQVPSLQTPSLQTPSLQTPSLQTRLPQPHLLTACLATANSLPSLLVIGDHTVETGSVIGEGGYSTVYSVTDQFTRKQLALKLVKLKPNEQSEIRQNLLDEVNLLKSLINVDHVVQLVSCRVTEDEVYMLMELGEGDLRKILAYIVQASRPLDVDFVRYWGGQVLKAVAAVHQHSIVHSDLKPANLLVVSGILKLCDFGIADTVPDNGTSVHRSVAVGTLKYMAPETLRSHQHATTVIIQPPVYTPHRDDLNTGGCWNNSGFCNKSNLSTASDAVFKVTKASDVWSCGVILYEMVYQKNPVQDFFDTKPPPVGCLEEFEIEHPKTAKGNTPVPLALHEVIRDCLRVTPKQRTSAEEACNSLFFAPVSIDLQAVLSIARNAYNFGHDLGSTHKDATPGKLEEHAEALYKKLTRLSKGM